MKINLVNYEEALGYDGILSKYAYRMERGLKELGHTVLVSTKPKKGWINHHINYQSYVHMPGKNTLQVTHITDEAKLASLKKGMETADLGICFSHQTEAALRKKKIKNLATVLPAHDGWQRRPRIVSILTNVYPNGCKREQMFAALLNHIDRTKFVFLVMGKDWEPIISPFAGLDFQGQYSREFEEKHYKQILDLSDYCLYFGKDEGSMGILDATNAGIPCIAPMEGFHAELNIAHPFDTQEELNAIFDKLSFNPAEDMTWESYCQQHVTLWEKLK